MSDPTIIDGIGTLVGTGGGGFGGGVVAKLLWDYFKSRDKYMTKVDCKESKSNCSLNHALKEEFLVLKSETTLKFEQYDDFKSEMKSVMKEMSNHMGTLSKAVAVIASQIKK